MELPHRYTFFLLCTTISIFLIVNLPSAASAATGPSNNTDFVVKSCAATTRYPDLCVTTLSPRASEIHASPKLLAATALSVALTAATSASRSLSGTATSSAMSSREAAAWRDCKGLVRDSVDQLRRSVNEMGGEEGKVVTRFQVSNVQTWASAAMTDLDTCTDGVSGEGMDGEVKKRVIGSGVVDVGHMISNALAFVNKYGDGIN